MNQILKNILPEETFDRMVNFKESVMEKLGFERKMKSYVQYDYL